jgi:alpha-tubulin suppressor-like RCC1 family protein
LGHDASSACGLGAACSLTPIQVQNIESVLVTALTGGTSHTCAVVNNAAYCWGDNQYGQLGNHTTASSAFPVQVEGLGTTVQRISAGDHHTCAIINGAVYCWGDNQFGQLGNGTTTASSVPVPVQSLSTNVTSIAAGLHHSCAVLDGSSVYCWGDNQLGQLGDNSYTSKLVPTHVYGFASRVNDVAASNHTCGISDQFTYCWGKNDFGQLGVNSTDMSSIPVQAGPGGAFISAGSSHTCIANGSVTCWGDNSFGQLGTVGSTAALHNTIAGIAFSAQATVVAAGGGHACGIFAGRAYCWGENTYGQLGDSTTLNNSIPVSPRFP